ncbi:MAG: HAD family hydrolase [Thermomicrobiales bacterium]|nr:HAD family hydrolase [Thermomicrobiales bacterium]
MTDRSAGQTLIFDADDTLWECNKYFEDAIHEFIDFLHHEHLSPEEVRLVIDKFERVNGYGAQAFAQSLVETYRELATENDPGDEERVRALGLRILDTNMETIPGVEETLRALLPRHQLLLCTKGDEEEQILKIRRSPLADYFEYHIVVEDKTVETYQEIVESFALDAKTSWMIGNSLKSDIYPALEAGINAIYVPNPHTWHMEHLAFDRADHWSGAWLEIERIEELSEMFG